MKLKQVELTHTLTNLNGIMPVNYLQSKDWDMEMNDEDWFFSIKKPNFAPEDTIYINKAIIKSFVTLPEPKIESKPKK